MAYQKINFLDQNVERPRTYELQENSDGTVTLIDSFGIITEIGTPINRENMNHIEDGIVSIENTIETLHPIGSPIIRLDNTLGDNEIRLEGAIVSRTTYSELFAKYGTTYGAGDGINTFQLPDFRNRVMWGGENLGYLEEQLPQHTHSYNKISGRSITTVGQGYYFYTTLETGQTGNADHSSYVDSGVVRPASVKVRVVTRYK